MRAVPSLHAVKPANILLVDDNAHGILARRTVLEEFGYHVTSASSGREALQLLDQHQFDLIVTDYRMPGMDGVALIGELRARDFQNPIVLLSGFLNHLGLTEQTTRADLLIQKSANETDQLVRAVKRLLAVPKKPPAPQGPRPAKKSNATKA
jgi:two-component system, NtrC family, response regulator GlrR